MNAAPPTPEDADRIARALVTHLTRTLIDSLAIHPPSRGMDAVDFSRFLDGEVRRMVAASEERIADCLPPIVVRVRQAAPSDPVIRAEADAARVRNVATYLRRIAQQGGYVRTKDGVRRVVEG